MKRLVTVQDLSCLGKCSLTVALPVISAMGVEAAVLPTAVLSTHTAFPSPAVTGLTHMMADVCHHWEKIGASFDGICTGYLSSPEQADRVLQLIQTFRKESTLVLTDPVMGDNGRLYDRITPDFLGRMRQLCSCADVILPNLTEACFLTDTPYPDCSREAPIRKLLWKLTGMGCKVAIITGITFDDGSVGFMGYERATDTYYHYSHKKLPHSYHGTGDIFSAVCAGAMVRGDHWQAAARLASDFTLRCIGLTAEEGGDSRFGVCFEKALPTLWKNH